MSDQFSVITASNSESILSGFTGIVLAHKKLCPHCKVMETVLGKVKALEPDISLASLDSEDEVDIMKKFGVERVPTLIVFKNGQKMTHKTGVMNPKETISFFMNA